MIIIMTFQVKTKDLNYLISLTFALKIGPS